MGSFNLAASNLVSIFSGSLASGSGENVESGTSGTVPDKTTESNNSYYEDSSTPSMI